MADPNQQFVAAVMTREQIAEDLNGYLDGMEYKGDGLSADDDRLTDGICLKYVAAISDAEGAGHTEDGLEEAIAEVQFDTLSQDLGFDLSSEEDEVAQTYIMVVTHDSPDRTDVSERKLVELTRSEAERLAVRANELFAQHATVNDDRYILTLERFDDSRWIASDFDQFLNDFERENIPRKNLAPKQFNPQSPARPETDPERFEYDEMRKMLDTMGGENDA